uniref:Uncharacterized protein n=1 Tax=Anguilla anguilla TaxID=7936 RepID=A0A0E9RGD3_ANGAN
MLLIVANPRFNIILIVQFQFVQVMPRKRPHKMFSDISRQLNLA